jgi:hypothetical protein
MIHYKTSPLRNGLGLIAVVVVLFLLTINLNGCSDSTTSPNTVAAEEPPVLPAAEQLQFDFSFFDNAAQLDKSHGEYDNFVNAYLRTVVLDVMAKLVLAAPVSAFSAAVHTVPVAQDDGDWIWTYTWRHPDGPVDIILRGIPAGDVVEWELSLRPDGLIEPVLWFSGTTNGDGSEGHWVFQDLDDPDHPVSGEIAWGGTGGGRYLEFAGREPGNSGDVLRFNDNDPDFSITFTPGDGSIASFIHWNVSGAGSLQVPDYNDGTEACWGEDLRNLGCH